MKNKTNKIDESWRKHFPGTKEYKIAIKKRDEEDYERYKAKKEEEYERTIKEWNAVLEKANKKWYEKALISTSGIKTKEDVIKMAEEFRDMYGKTPTAVKKEEKNAFIRVLLQLLDILS